MDKKLKAKWIAALRSGRYKQEQGALYDEHSGGFCCLGVLCVVAGAKRAMLEGHGFPGDIEGYEDVLDKRIARRLAHLNDEHEVPFEMLAGLIHEAL